MMYARLPEPNDGAVARVSAASAMGAEGDMRRLITWLSGGAVAVLLALVVPASAGALPTAQEVLAEMPVSDIDRERILNGEIVSWSASEGSDRELAFGMVLRVKATTAELVELYHRAILFRVIPGVWGYGKLTSADGMEELARLRLKPDAEKEAARYFREEPGGELNLANEERAAFRAIRKSKGESITVEDVEALIRQTLSARYQAFRTRGLDGVAPYARGRRKSFDPAGDLRSATKQLTGIQRYLPGAVERLLAYPSGGDLREQEESYYWMNIELFGRPTFALSHRMLFQEGDGLVLADRQYYASHDYNVMQQVFSALPLDTGTLVVYIGRVSTDQVAGFGSRLKRKAAHLLAAPYYKDLFEEVRTRSEKLHR